MPCDSQGSGQSQGPGAAPLPQLLEQSPLGPGFIRHGGQGVQAPLCHPPPAELPAPGRDLCPSHVGAPGPCVAAFHLLAHTSWGRPLTPFLSWWRRGDRAARFPVRNLRCVTSRGKAPSSFCSPPPHSPRRPGSGGGRRAMGEAPTPAPPSLSSYTPGFCFPHPSSLETDLIWDCYKNNNNPNAEKPRKGLRVTLPPHRPPPSPFQTEYKTAPKADILYRGVGGWGASGRGGPGVALYKSRLVMAPAVPVGPLGCRRCPGASR